MSELQAIATPLAATGASNWSLRAMLPRDVDAVVDIERASHESPWSTSNFLDALRESLYALVLERSIEPDLGNTQAVTSAAHATNPAQTRHAARPCTEVLGYFVSLLGVDELQLLNIAVHPDWRRQGLARVLLARLSAEATRLNKHAVWLEVRASNHGAQQLYERLGYQRVGQRRGFYAKPDGSREDAWLYSLTLPQTVPEPA